MARNLAKWCEGQCHMPSPFNAVVMGRSSKLSRHDAVRAEFSDIRNYLAHCEACGLSDEIKQKPMDLIIHQHHKSRCTFSVAEKTNYR